MPNWGCPDPASGPGLINQGASMSAPERIRVRGTRMRYGNRIGQLRIAVSTWYVHLPPKGSGKREVWTAVCVEDYDFTRGF